ncbi:hypothetical protein GCM10027563_05400 [Parasphingorhabdus pacifica]
MLQHIAAVAALGGEFTLDDCAEITRRFANSDCDSPDADPIGGPPDRPDQIGGCAGRGSG